MKLVALDQFDASPLVPVGLGPDPTREARVEADVSSEVMTHVHTVLAFQPHAIGVEMDIVHDGIRQIDPVEWLESGRRFGVVWRADARRKDSPDNGGGQKFTPIHALILALLLCASPLAAQPLKVDQAFHPWAPEHQHTAHVLSNVTLWTSVGLGVLDAWQAEDRTRSLGQVGLQFGIAQAIGFTLKRVVHRARPCAPDTCGPDNPNYSVPSGHTLSVTATLSRRYFAIQLPLTGETGLLRMSANRHYLTDVLAGAAIGAVTNAVIR